VVYVIVVPLLIESVCLALFFEELLVMLSHAVNKSTITESMMRSKR